MGRPDVRRAMGEREERVFERRVDAAADRSKDAGSTSPSSAGDRQARIASPNEKLFHSSSSAACDERLHAGRGGGVASPSSLDDRDVRLAAHPVAPCRATSRGPRRLPRDAVFGNNDFEFGARDDWPLSWLAAIGDAQISSTRNEPKWPARFSTIARSRSRPSLAARGSAGRISDADSEAMQLLGAVVAVVVGDVGWPAIDAEERQSTIEPQPSAAGQLLANGLVLGQLGQHRRGERERFLFADSRATISMFQFIATRRGRLGQRSAHRFEP